MLADLEQLTGQQATRLLGRVPFSRAQVESYLRLDAGWLEQLALQGSRVMERRHPAEAQRVGDFLARFVVEGLPIGALPAVSLYQEGEGFLPLFDGDEGERIMVVCPTCNNEFILGSTAGFRLLYAEDVPDLLRHYVDRLVDSDGLAFRRFSVAAQNRLRNYPWPDNVRELRTLVQRLLVQGGSEEIRLEEIESARRDMPDRATWRRMV